ncbi:hypothetical protein [Cytobacillus praedii]|uniref:hypothetical protein n=1 Tax=Cytobacillus praedii TaxID=1742358 RepID=UPI002E1B19C6|nr:helix-turn-helix transcriptional regulator [Cytobacillus praedii]
MSKSDLQPVTIETMGFSQREFLTLFILKELKESGPSYPRALYKLLISNFTGKVHSYDYLSKIAKQLAANGDLLLIKEAGRNYYELTEKGKKLYGWYQQNFKERLVEIKKVIDRFVFDITGSGERTPVDHELPEEYRRYFSKIVSVKDLVRYVTLKTASTRSNIYMGEIGELLKTKYGWIASNGYIYDISSEMEACGSLIGQWESEKRTKRHLRLTEEGKIHLKQIADDAAHRVKDVQHYLKQVLQFL